MALIKKFNAKVNTTYVYESISYWDKDLKQPRSKRKLIGKIDPETGEIVPTGKRGRKASAAASPSVTDKTDETVAPVIEAVPVTTNETTEDTSVKELYEECRRQLLEKEAALAKAESTVARLQSEKKDLAEQLEQLVKRLKH